MSGLTLMAVSERELEFEVGPDPGHPFKAEVDGHQVLIRLGDFPVEAMYTLIVDGEEGEEFDDWPPAWKRPEKKSFLSRFLPRG